ncbi:hypothetical protein CGC45_07045 [Francisella opportunistica]|nr:hypothetical protein CGC45_07045 [Francisella opportunistica]
MEEIKSEKAVNINKIIEIDMIASIRDIPCRYLCFFIRILSLAYKSEPNSNIFSKCCRKNYEDKINTASGKD